MYRLNFRNITKKFVRVGVALAAAMAMVLPMYADAPSTRAQPLTNNDQPKVLRTAELIRRNLVTLPNYGVFDDLKFSINGSEVTLDGFASRPTLKTDAARVVESVEGVESVVNRIEVLPVSSFDDQIRLRAYVAIYRNSSLRKYSTGGPIMPRLSPMWLAGGITNNPPIGWNPIHIIVKNGNVTLTGVVDRDMDKQIIGMAANRVPGVFSVNNELSIATGGASGAAAKSTAS